MDDLRTMAGRYEELIGKLQLRYRDAHEKAMRQEVDFAKIVLQLRQANARLETLLTRLKETRHEAARKSARAPSRRPHKSRVNVYVRARRKATGLTRRSGRRPA
jgi:anti-sigma-K factor RskA